MFMLQDSNVDEFISSLGNIYGVSELTVKDNQEKKAACPVVVAENALVFLAWEYETVQN